jgi:pyruvate dehydrogenase E2 component (dihydrolipoamide acetyltransferase)
MAHFEFRLPDIGEGVAEGEVVAWHVEPGQVVTEDQEMVEVMTDKATVTIGAPKAGRITSLNAQVGEKVAVGSVLVVIDMASGAAAANGAPAHAARSPDHDTVISRFQAPAHDREAAEMHARRAIEETSPDRKDEGPAATAVGDIRESLPGSAFFAKKPAQNGHAPSVAAQSVQDTSFFSAKPLATPATRKLARDLGVDLRQVRPTGDGGRVTKDDVQAFGSGGLQQAGHKQVAKSSSPVGAPAAGSETRKPFVGLRRKIAERMRLAKDKAAHFTFVEECEVDHLKAVIERLRPAAEKQGIKLNYLPFITKAVTLALKKHSILNSTLDEAKNELVYRGYYNIGIAAATEQGLVVPVVHDADRMNILQLAREIQRLGDGARTGQLKNNDMVGSTFTITSLGKQGGLLATPVLNHPEVGILGVHRVKERAIVKNGQIVIGNVMLLSLSFDHRIIDGHIGAAFAYEVISYLENPDLLLLELS